LTDNPHILNGGIAFDDRGSVSFCNDFLFQEAQVKRFYHISNIRKDYIRAWHGHHKEAKYMYSADGTFRVGAVNMETEEQSVFYLDSRKPQLLYIPSGYANGFQNLTENNQLMIFSTSTLEESLGDDTRFDWRKWNIWNKEDYR
jgi:dTDP-4-dehydrorhamnose 3,5-epimerase-like enzyme